MIAVYCGSQSHTKPVIFYGENVASLIIKAGGTYNYHWAPKVKVNKLD
jgi:hypothetical protein